MATLRAARLGLLLPFVLATPARAAGPDPVPAYVEPMLRAAGVATDGPGLLAYLRQHTLSEVDRLRLEAAVPRVGYPSSWAGERPDRLLIDAGPPAVPFLRRALRDPDPEVARGAAFCLKEIGPAPEFIWLAAAVRLTAQRRPAGAAEALLAYLPSADESGEGAVFVALEVVGLRGGQPEPAVVAALGDKHPLRRAAAARVVSRAGDAGQRRPVARLLSDPDARVRYEAAAGLVRAGDQAAVHALVALLAEAPVSLALLAEDLHRAAQARAAEPDPVLVYAEQTLKAAGVSTDGPELLAYIRKHTLSEADRERLAVAVRCLGADNFPDRERASRLLVAARRLAVPFLKPALGDSDPEVVRRAARCLKEIERGPDLSLLAAAVRLTAQRRPAGAAEALLAYLPGAGNASVEEAVFESLTVVGLRWGRPGPALIAALGDKHALRRAAAAHVVSRTADAGQRRRVARLLGDPDARVRYEAAAGLALAGDRAAVPALVALLTEAPLSLAWQAEELLYGAAGDSPPAVTLRGRADEARRKWREGWEAWWKEWGPRVDLARLRREDAYRGLTLVCEQDEAGGDTGRVIVLGREGKPHWQVAGLQEPHDAQLLPGGRVLVAEGGAHAVTERDRHGMVLWRHECEGRPLGCQRLPGGNTFVCTPSRLYEASPAGEMLFVYPLRLDKFLCHAVRLRDGRVVYVPRDGRVSVLDARGQLLRTTTPSTHRAGAIYRASVEPLPGGRFLLALGGADGVVEIDAAGKVIWQCKQNSAMSATRLRNGHTLIASAEGRCLVEVDRAGKEVGRVPLQGRPFAVRRY
jgi:HEAT repeat protein